MILETWSDLADAMTSGSDWRFVVKTNLKRYGLTGRQEDVIWELLAGKSNREIADTLFISEDTVKNHTTPIFQKLRVRDREQAILVLLGIIEPTIPLESKPPITAFAVDRKQGIGVRHGFDAAD